MGAIFATQHECDRTITTAEIAHPVGRPKRSSLRDEPSQVGGGFIRGFPPGDPVTVMQIGSPNAAIEIIELVIMSGYGDNVGDFIAWDDHDDLLRYEKIASAAQLTCKNL
jgi:hypothetical protein